jgi:hypothetical protein
VSDLFDRFSRAEAELSLLVARVRRGDAGSLSPLDRDWCAAEVRGCARQVDELLALLCRPPADSTEARVVAETNRIIDEARDREQGEEP